ncbi:helix-turn-helix transcriptional regulator [Catenulispora rubra]|uniref:helix-turn-helix transcriptional regulator n=1 Tax=Catenulispora rubra TaxID=280293 RepID=UPI001892414E|nr:metalloregulator ArsR/SmtB family transcription factor [Catenulispora rubra]
MESVPNPSVSASSSADDVSDVHVGTRNRVARSILANGPSTAVDLGKRLKMTPAGVRRHLDALLAENLVEARQQRTYGQRGRGRPAKVFALTDRGRGVFYQAYDQLAVDALKFLADSAGSVAVEAFARKRVAELADRFRERMESVPAEERPALLAKLLTEDGYAAGLRETGNAPAAGEQLCQHHCPVAHVAEQFPQLCEAETEVFAELLGTHVQRLATIAHGDGVCTTFIPMTVSATGTSKSTEVSGRVPL